VRCPSVASSPTSKADKLLRRLTVTSGSCVVCYPSVEEVEGIKAKFQAEVARFTALAGKVEELKGLHAKLAEHGTI
jgi:NifB/MoaA-like Fe-S oxidoreductase